MLKSIRIANFKAFGDLQEIPLGRITLIYGPNSAGKSSIIQSILLMRQSMQSTSITESRIVFSGEDVNLGTYASALFQHKSENKMRLGFSFSSGRAGRSNPYRGVFGRNFVKSVDIGLDFAKPPLKDQQGDAWITDINYGFSDGTSEPTSVQLTRIKAKKAEPTDIEDTVSIPDFSLKDPASAVNLSRLFSFVQSRLQSRQDAPVPLLLSSAQEDPETTKFLKRLKYRSYGFLPVRPDLSRIDSIPANSRFTLTSAWGPFETITRDFFEEMTTLSYLGPLRSPPARHYIISGSDRKSVGSRGERMPQLLYRRKRYILPKLNEMIEEFGIPYKIDIESAGNTLTGDIITIVLSDRSNVRVSPSDVGFGIGQLLPILVEGVVSVGKTICVEQPEIHLHPRLQAHVADFLIETAKSHGSPAKSGSRTASTTEYGGNQWIVETHSEALIMRLQTLIKKQAIPADFITVLYVESTLEKGARVTRLRLDEEGDFIDEWPDGFFEEGFQEIFVRRR
jgi:hypothetical protein